MRTLLLYRHNGDRIDVHTVTLTIKVTPIHTNITTYYIVGSATELMSIYVYINYERYRQTSDSYNATIPRASAHVSHIHLRLWTYVLINVNSTQRTHTNHRLQLHYSDHIQTTETRRTTHILGTHYRQISLWTGTAPWTWYTREHLICNKQCNHAARIPGREG